MTCWKHREQLTLAERTAYECISVNTNCLSIYFILYLSSVLKLFLIYILYIPNNFIFSGTNINGNMFEIKIFTYLLLVYGTVTDFISYLSCYKHQFCKFFS